jgi:hypothetical protein
MMANESLGDPWYASGLASENAKWMMCTFSCARAFLNGKRKQKESGV